MALTLTVGSNTYVTLSEADSYLEGKLGAGDWFTLTSDNQKQCLISSYRWLRRLGLPASSTSDNVKSAQIELAWWLYRYYEEHEDREALYANGVRQFKLSKWSENLSESDVPQFIKDLIGDLIGVGGYFPTFSRELNE
jgi:hypothetical protein